MDCLWIWKLLDLWMIIFGITEANWIRESHSVGLSESSLWDFDLWLTWGAFLAKICSYSWWQQQKLWTNVFQFDVCHNLWRKKWLKEHQITHYTFYSIEATIEPSTVPHGKIVAYFGTCMCSNMNEQHTHHTHEAKGLQLTWHSVCARTMVTHLVSIVA